MSYEIKTRKGFSGWRAESSVKLADVEGGERILEISTSKGINGGLSSFASVSICKDEGAFTSRTTMIFGDYTKHFNRTPCSRITEKAVTEAHKAALEQFPAIIEEAKAFYAAKDADAAA